MNVDEPDPGAEQAAGANAGEEVLEEGDAESKYGDSLTPGDSDLADAWWAR